MTTPDLAAYRRALDALYARTGGAWRLGLERMTALMEALGHPERRFPVFHVAGTNGKGSTVATLDALLRGGGARVGRYTSPHLVDFSERIAVEGVPMRPEAITAWLEARLPLLTELGATFFEATTALALAHFADVGVDVAVIEVGLGGRLDATNVVHPVAAGVTQIGLDHQEFLGTTPEAIAMEKAGIFKAGAAAVVGDTAPGIRSLLQARAEAVGATPVLVTGRDWQVRDVELDPVGTHFTLEVAGRTRRLATPLVGRFQADNAAVALAMLRAAGGRWAAIEAEADALLAGVRLPGRFHRSGPWLFDVAHNPDGAATVVATVRAVAVSRPLVAVVSVLNDKDWRGILAQLATVADRILVTVAPSAPPNRAWSLEAVCGWAAEAGVAVERFDDLSAALNAGRRAGGTVLVTGSFHTVGDAMERLQVNPVAR
ncbi:MAG: bifunctional folylpolyglutamate synthase/dihydrofolate synthase [Gemmatimonadetes bacterium]|nr:bifunctional folylpolyglutamate synthase/dihydrofolate synthase [Gemmatimonadota bacterium]